MNSRKDIEVIEYRQLVNTYKIGHLKVRYHDLVLKCDLVLYMKEGVENLWIRMPEHWTGKIKISYCRWPERPISDFFQMMVLHDLSQNHGVSLSKSKDLMMADKARRGKNQKSLDKIKKQDYANVQ